MSSTDLVRTSRDGDQFHYLWASRRALLLLSNETKLRQLTIEGVSPIEFDNQHVTEGEYVVDVAEYYGGDNFKTANKIKYYQLKHTTVAKEEPFPPSKLKNTLEGFSERYSRLVEVVGKEIAQAKLEFIFVSNRPIHVGFHESITQIASGNPTSQTNQKKIEDFTSLKGSELSDFCKLITFDINADDYWEQRNILAFETARYLPGPDAYSAMNLKELITRKALSESKNDNSINKIDVLRALNTDTNNLFPATNKIEQIKNPIFRAQEEQFVAYILNDPSNTFIIQAEGGVGKTVFASHINEFLPSDSVSILYDCFGSGDYRNLSTFRHTHRVALVQIANEIASKGLCHPLIPSSLATDSDYIRAFLSRIQQASEKLHYINPNAVISIVVDAADNAQMAAEELGETRSFIKDLLKEPFSENVKLISFCRPYRLQLLDAPSSVKNLCLDPFTIEETRYHLEQHYSQISSQDLLEFHRLTSQNPRIQKMALTRKQTLPDTLRFFGTNPKSIEDTISDLLEAAINEIKKDNFIENYEIDRLCESIAILRPLIPIKVLEQLSQVSAAQIRSFISDIGGHPIRLLDDYIQFVDEPTETWFRDKYRPYNIESLRTYVATLKPLTKNSPYIASILPHLMLESEEYQELFDTVLHSLLLPETSSLEKRHIEVQRLQFAIKAGIKLDRLLDVAKLSLKAGGESAAQTRQNILITENLDLAAIFFEDNRIQEMLANNIFVLENRWVGAKFAYEAQLMSYKKNLVVEAGSKLRIAKEWFNNWFKLPDIEKRQKPIGNNDITKIFITHFNIYGVEESLIWLNKWKSKLFIYDVAAQVAQEFLLHNRFSDLKSMLEHAGNNIYFTLGVVTEAIDQNFVISKPYLTRSFRILSYKSVIIRLNDHNKPLRLHVITNYLIACLKAGVCDSIAASDVLSRYMPTELPYELKDTHGHFSKSIHLTAYALLSKWRGEVLAVEDIINENTADKIKNSNSYSETEDTIGSLKKLIPWYTLLVNSLLSDTPVTDIEEVIDSAKNTLNIPNSDSYRFNLRMADDIAQVWFAIIIVNNYNIDKLVTELFDYFDNRKINLTPKTLNKFIRICCQYPDLEDMAYELSQQNFERAVQSKVNANEILEDIVEVARAILPLDKMQSESYFGKAIEVSGKIGDENFSRWEALTYHAFNIENIVHDDNHPELAYRFARCAELTHKYMYEDHFNWEKSVKALVNIHPTSSLTIASRWRDRRFGEDEIVINAIGESLLQKELIAPVSLLSLLCLKSGFNLEKILKNIQFETLDSDVQIAIVLIIYQYQIIPNPSEDNRALLEHLYSECSLKVDKVRSFLETYELDEIIEKDSRYVSHSIDKKMDWDAIFVNDQLDSNYDYDSAKTRYLSIEGNYSLDDNYHNELQRRLSNKYIYKYIESTLEDPKIGMYEVNLIFREIPNKWENRAAVRECFGKNFKLYCRRHAAELFISLRDHDPKLISLMSSVSNIPESEFIKEILLGRSESSELLDSDSLFNMVSMISKVITPDASKSVLGHGLTLLEEELSDDTGDGEWSTDLIPPDTIEAAYAGYLISGLASPFLYTRWLNTHAIKVLGELKQTPILDALIHCIENKSARAFTDSRFIYYRYTALQWLLIAFLKISNEYASTVVPYVDFFKSNISPDKPHILIRLYSAKILLNLNRQGLISLTCTEIKDCESIGVSNFKVIEKDEVNLDKYQYIKQSSVDSFGVDFGPYWLKPLGRCFGLHNSHINYETSLVKKHYFNNISKASRREDSRYEYNVYGNGTRHSHGSAPLVEDLSFYTNYHSMMITADLLLNQRPLISESWYTFSSWLSKYDFTLINGAWLADYRDHTPKRTTDWHTDVDQRGLSWEYSISSSDFDEHFDFDNEWLPIWGNWTEVFNDKEKDFNIRSSLVDMQSSHSLLRSLRTYKNPHDYCLPRFGDNDFTINNGVFRLLPWLSESEYLDATIFEKDPWSASINYQNLRPTDDIILLMKLSSDPLGKNWFDKKGSEVIRTRYWGKLNSRNEEYSRGSNMLVSKQFLIDLLQLLDMNLIISFSGEHRLNSRYGKDEDNYDELGYIPNSEKVYLITKDGVLHGY